MLGSERRMWGSHDCWDADPLWGRTCLILGDVGYAPWPTPLWPISFVTLAAAVPTRIPTWCSCVRTLHALGALETSLAGMCRLQHFFFGMPLLCSNPSPVGTLYPLPHHLCPCAPPNSAAPHLLHTPVQQHPHISRTWIWFTLVQSGAWGPCVSAYMYMRYEYMCIPDLAQLCLHRQHHFPDGRAITRTLSISPPPALLVFSLSAVRQPPWSFRCCSHPPIQDRYAWGWVGVGLGVWCACAFVCIVLRVCCEQEWVGVCFYTRVYTTVPSLQWFAAPLHHSTVYAFVIMSSYPLTNLPYL